MPAEPLIDLDALDLSRTVIGREQLYQVLQHRGTFMLLDGVLHRGGEDDLVIVGYKDIRADDWWAPDHVPGRPIFPGALMVEAGAQLCSYDYTVRVERSPDDFIGFAGMKDTRFRGVVEPGARLIFAGRVLRMRSAMFTYAVQGFVDGRIVFETDVMGVAL